MTKASTGSGGYNRSHWLRQQPVGSGNELFKLCDGDLARLNSPAFLNGNGHAATRCERNPSRIDHPIFASRHVASVLRLVAASVLDPLKLRRNTSQHNT